MRVGSIILRMEILVLVAGTNDPSNSNVLSDSFIEGIQEAGEITVNKRQLKDMKIDHFDLSYYDPKCKMEKDFSDRFSVVKVLLLMKTNSMVNVLDCAVGLDFVLGLY